MGAYTQGMWNIQGKKVKHNQRVWDSLKPDFLREKEFATRTEMDAKQALGNGGVTLARAVPKPIDGTTQIERAREQGCEGLGKLQISQLQV